MCQKYKDLYYLNTYLWPLMSHLRTYIAFFLLAAISLYVAPKDLLHELGGHQHTEDVICTDTCAHHVSKAHHHCDCLQLSSPPLYHSVHNFSFILSELLCLQPVENVTGYSFSLSP